MEFEIGPEMEPGVHADVAAVWHTPSTFVLDFAALRQPPVFAEDEDTGKRFVRVPTRVVARVRIPPDQVFELMKTLEQQLSAWELETGRREPPDPGVPKLD
jgi:Protein of unknown function (DUF3467)